MKKLALFALAAGAATAAAPALAQPGPGHTWGGPRGPAGPAPHVTVRRDGPAVQHRRGPAVHHRQGPVAHHRRGPRFGHIPRIHRGVRVHRFWIAPQFHVRNWQMYGFPQPGHERRWIRYYDDALLVDRGGMVHDGRYGLDWDQYGDAWGYDQRGIPVYVGRGDYRPGPEDHAWAEYEADAWDMSEYAYGAGHGSGHYQGGYHEGGGQYRGAYGPGPALPPPGHGYGGGYGYSHVYGYGGATITETITETTVSTAQTGYIEEVVEEVVQTRRPRVRRAPRPRCDCPPPRPVRRAPPPAGERG